MNFFSLYISDYSVCMRKTGRKPLKPLKRKRKCDVSYGGLPGQTSHETFFTSGAQRRGRRELWRTAGSAHEFRTRKISSAAAVVPKTYVCRGGRKFRKMRTNYDPPYRALGLINKQWVISIIREFLQLFISSWFRTFNVSLFQCSKNTSSMKFSDVIIVHITDIWVIFYDKRKTIRI